MELSDSINYHTEGLVAEDYETRILILVSVLADSDLAFRGTIPKMIEGLGLGNQTITRDKVKSAIKTLEDKGYIYSIKDDNIYTITISKKAMEDDKIIKLRKEGIEIIKNHKALLPKDKYGRGKGAIGSNLLKVFIVCRECKGDIITIKDKAREIGMCGKTFNNCVKLLNQLDLREYGLRLYTFTKPKKHYIKETDEGFNEGLKIEMFMSFDDGANMSYGTDDECIPCGSGAGRVFWPDDDEYEYDIDKGVSY